MRPISPLGSHQLSIDQESGETHVAILSAGWMSMDDVVGDRVWDWANRQKHDA